MLHVNSTNGMLRSHMLAAWRRGPAGLTDLRGGPDMGRTAADAALSLAGGADVAVSGSAARRWRTQAAGAQRRQQLQQTPKAAEERYVNI